jgi:hydrogenase maturation protease
MKNIIIMGCGNVLASDDGVGIQVVRELAHATLPPGVKLIEAGVAGLGILDYFNGQDKAIVIDAVLAGRKPGTVLVFSEKKLPDKSMMPWSLHGVGLLEALQLGYLVEAHRMPKELVIVGIQVKQTASWQEGLSKEVELAVPEAARIVVKNWR